MAPLSSMITTLLRRSQFDGANFELSPMAVHDLSIRDDPNPNGEVHFGVGATPAHTFNNQGFLALFAILGTGMALVAIWFFFWAKNGGFKWHKDDWDDYKSTVLRRKGPDGKTLSNATKSTNLGGGSIVAPPKTVYTDDSASSAMTDDRDVERGDYAHEGHRATRDPELAHYRSERPARVGGMNRNYDGSHWDSSNTDRSAVSSDRQERTSDRAERKARRARRREERERDEARHSRQPREQPEMEMASSYYQSYRPSQPPSYQDDTDSGTKSYPCKIPGLSRVEDDIAPSESVSNIGMGPKRAGPGQGASGFRRGGGMRVVHDEEDGF
ncbi:hypothetical protein P152DRAFT_130287 [Eremomyces bilateralis CBS 781.70]|uniref:Endosomal SPRY domain-containing protein n=1 Tax=Eremomyces bilateralis CBS 781.70 TaxID=1392243 RepID=A0A6G1GFD3_9PEZI|nr:uncharacterized protein P152DRAFT_130287 [Eremomyces bilateralis CBS 781.70]KAF1816621.1 hypothetical protein P152DRAFT_130287 [Eremomyces bilateralis CBS 781.70]